MTPDFRILADSKDMTATIADRLLSLSVSDEAGFKSDEVSFTVDDRDDAVALPRKGAELEVFLGYAETRLARMGTYVVDEVAHTGPPAALAVKAKAADMRASLKTRKTRSWDKTMLGKVVEVIASEHGYTPKVFNELANVEVVHIDQNEESDMHFLTRLAKERKAVFKPGGGSLIFAPRGSAKSVSGRRISAVNVTGKDVARWNYSAPDRGRYKSVLAHWHSPHRAELVPVTVGSGEPVFTIPRPFQDYETAHAAAQGKLLALERGKATLNMTLAGNPALMAEAKMTVSSISKKVDGQWLITRVSHRIDGSSGYVCNVAAETV